MSNNLLAIDLTSEPEDRLTALPSELQHIIISYLFPTHDPRNAFELGLLDLGTVLSTFHPLDCLAATCRTLRANIMDWALHELTQHRNVTKYKELKTAKLQAQRNFLRGKSGGGLLTWAEKHCVFCGKKSSRSAILMNGLRCCTSCDKEQWPNKITKTDAKRIFDLKDHHLLPNEHHSPGVVKLLANHPGGLPRLRYGTYMSSNVPTTMFLRKDVEALAEFAHGDLKAHLAKRQADREVRRKKARVAKAARDADAVQQDPQELLHHVTRLFQAGASATNPVVVEDSEGLSSLIVENSYITDSDMFADEGGLQGMLWSSP